MKNDRKEMEKIIEGTTASSSQENEKVEDSKIQVMRFKDINLILVGEETGEAFYLPHCAIEIRDQYFVIEQDPEDVQDSPWRIYSELGNPIEIYDEDACYYWISRYSEVYQIYIKFVDGDSVLIKYCEDPEVMKAILNVLQKKYGDPYPDPLKINEF